MHPAGAAPAARRVAAGRRRRDRRRRALHFDRRGPRQRRVRDRARVRRARDGAAARRQVGRQGARAGAQPRLGRRAARGAGARAAAHIICMCMHVLASARFLCTLASPTPLPTCRLAGPFSHCAKRLHPSLLSPLRPVKQTNDENRSCTTSPATQTSSRCSTPLRTTTTCTSSQSSARAPASSTRRSRAARRTPRERRRRSSARCCAPSRARTTWASRTATSRCARFGCVVYVCVGVCWCVLVCVGVCWCVSVCVGVCWCVLLCLRVAGEGVGCAVHTQNKSKMNLLPPDRPSLPTARQLDVCRRVRVAVLAQARRLGLCRLHVADHAAQGPVRDLLLPRTRGADRRRLRRARRRVVGGRGAVHLVVRAAAVQRRARRGRLQGDPGERRRAVHVRSLFSSLASRLAFPPASLLAAAPARCAPARCDRSLVVLPPPHPLRSLP